MKKYTKIDRARTEIESLLRRSVSEGDFYYIKSQAQDFMPHYKEILAIRDTYQLHISIPYETFKSHFFAFRQNEKKYGFRQASDTFWQSVIKDSKKPPIIPQIKDEDRHKQKIAGKKIVRKNDLKYYNDLMVHFDRLKKMRLLLESIKWISYECEKKGWDIKQSFLALADFYGVSTIGLTKNKQRLRGLLELNYVIWELIQALKENLKYSIEKLFNDRHVPKAKKWFVDLFGEHSRRYLADWEAYKKKPSVRDFEKSNTVFRQHVRGVSALELGINRQKNHDLRYRIVPQGKIYFLYIIHNLLYYAADQEKVLITGTSKKIKDLLNSLLPAQASEVLDSIRTEEWEQVRHLPAIPEQVNLREQIELLKIIDAYSACQKPSN